MPKRFIARHKQRIKHMLQPLVKRYAPKRTDLPLSLWNLSRDASGALQLDGISLRTLLGRYGSPLHVVDGKKLGENLAQFTHTPAGASRGCEVFYSYKTNPVPGILQQIHAQGIGAEVISEYELWLALKLCVAPQHIVYNGPAKSDVSLWQAIQHEIELINLNSREEIALLAGLARRAGKRPRVGIRVVVAGGWAGQFGEPIQTGAALRAFEEAAACPELDLVALHAHLGNEISSLDQVTNFVERVLAFGDQVYARFGLELGIIDLGGSLACPTTVHLSPRDVRLNTTFHCDLVPRAPELVLGIREYVGHVLALVEEHYRRAGRPMPRVFLEPGRSLTGNTQMLLCQVMRIKAAEERTYAVLDAGINLAECVRNEYHQLLLVDPARSQHAQTYRLVGPICTPADVLYPAWDLPELAPGDALAIMDAGAYFVPFATSFSFPQPAIVLVEAGHDRLLRRAETFEDLVALDLEPGLATSMPVTANPLLHRSSI